MGIHTKPRDDRIAARGYCVENFRYDATAFDGLSRDRFLEALRAEGVPVSDGYEMPLYRHPTFFRNEVGRLLPPGPWWKQRSTSSSIARNPFTEESRAVYHMSTASIEDKIHRMKVDRSGHLLCVPLTTRT